MKHLKKFNIRSIKFFFVAIFFFILGCMVTINLLPINKTCLLDKDREYDIMRNSKLHNPDLIIIIVSAPNNAERRDYVRRTWLKLDSFRNTKTAKHFFVIGSSNLSPDDIIHLSSEQSKNNDLIIIPMFDTYENLTQKVLLSFVYLKEQLDVGLNFKYVLKCDDDSFVRLDNLLHELDSIELMYIKSNPKNLNRNVNSSPYLSTNIQANEITDINNLQLYWGYFHGRGQIKQKGKWQEKNWILCDYYLPYALGGGYILSKELVVYLARNANSLRYYKSEDVSVGAWLSTVNNVLRVHDTRFDTEWTSRGCQNYHLISHNIETKRLQARYSNIHRFGIMCEMEQNKRVTYMYNWTLPASKCCANFV